MAAKRANESKGEDEDVALWRALARFTSEDFEVGLKDNTDILSGARSRFQRHRTMSSFIRPISGGLIAASLLCLFVSKGPDGKGALLLIIVVCAAGIVAPQIWQEIYQYGFKIPKSPLNLPHEADPHFEEFLAHLQNPSGPRAYYFSNFDGKRKELNRRNFFGRLRYFLFSEDSFDRGLVLQYQTAMSVPVDLYLHRDDVAKMIALREPKRRGGPGRSTKYKYIDAILSLIGDPRFTTLHQQDRAAVIKTINGWMSEWFEAMTDASGDMPRYDQLKPYAERLFDFWIEKPSAWNAIVPNQTSDRS